MRKAMAFGTFKWSEKAQNSLGQLQKYFFLVKYKAQLHIYLGTCTILRKCQIMHSVCWDLSCAQADRSSFHITFSCHYYFPSFPITLTVAWQLLLVPFNAKVLQLPCCNASCKGARSALHKQLYWEFGVSSLVFVLL